LMPKGEWDHKLSMWGWRVSPYLSIYLSLCYGHVWTICVV
jgi:hypothetical protein